MQLPSSAAYWLISITMDNNTRVYIETELLTISEVAALLGLTVAAAMKRAERSGWDHVLKGRQKLYSRGDFDPSRTAKDEEGGSLTR